MNAASALFIIVSTVNSYSSVSPRISADLWLAAPGAKQRAAPHAFLEQKKKKKELRPVSAETKPSQRLLRRVHTGSARPEDHLLPTFIQNTLYTLKREESSAHACEFSFSWRLLAQRVSLLAAPCPICRTFLERSGQSPRELHPHSPGIRFTDAPASLRSKLGFCTQSLSGSSTKKAPAEQGSLNELCC